MNAAVLGLGVPLAVTVDNRRWAVVREGVGWLHNVHHGVSEWRGPSEAVLFADEASAQHVADLLGNAYTTLVVLHD